METKQTIRLSALQDHLWQYDEMLQAAIEDSEIDIIAEEIEHEWSHQAIDLLEQNEQLTKREKKMLQLHHQLLQQYQTGILSMRNEQQSILTTKIIVESVRDTIEAIELFSPSEEIGINQLKDEIQKARRQEKLFKFVVKRIEAVLNTYRVRNRICILDVFRNIDSYIERTIQLILEDDVDE